MASLRKKKEQIKNTSNEKKDITTYAVDYKKVGEYDEHYFNKIENLGEKSPSTFIALYLIKVLPSNLNSGSK